MGQDKDSIVKEMQKYDMVMIGYSQDTITVIKNPGEANIEFTIEQQILKIADC